ncbi:MAG TPA: hypothetical protein DCG47_13775 [Spirochaetaceae bacterium]|jgi:hypothetical protein|nr:hypothetical protein [Spirochaetaceae bacterium]
MKKLYALYGFLALLFCLQAQSAFAQEILAHKAGQEPYELYFELGLTGRFEGQASTEESLAFLFEDELFTLSARGVMNNDGKYDAELASIPGGKFFGNYILMQEGGATVRYKDLRFKAGRFRHYDELPTPYSLFINAQGNSANIMELRYENEAFLYQSRWIELNYRSAFQSGEADPLLRSWHVDLDGGTDNGYSGFPDRGANVKTYALKFGGMRIGYQDAAVYTGLPGSGRNFDFEYFLNPIPQYFIQYVKATAGRPWTTGDDENNFLGLFWDWNADNGAYYYVQTLLDDFNIKFLFPDTFGFPYKAGWALGGRWDTPYGRFGFHHAGSPMYSFEPITTSSTATQWQSAYGYTYYPETRYWLEESGEAKAISIEDNMIGYVYGENTLAFMGEWSHTLFGMDWNANLEYRLAGSSSPANPWHDGRYHPEGTRLLDEDVIESRLLSTLGVVKAFGPLRISWGLKLGYVFNERSLRAPLSPEPGWSAVDRNVWLWEPVSGAHRMLFALSVGIAYRLEPLKGLR